MTEIKTRRFDVLCPSCGKQYTRRFIPASDAPNQYSEMPVVIWEICPPCLELENEQIAADIRTFSRGEKRRHWAFSAAAYAVPVAFVWLFVWLAFDRGGVQLGIAAALLVVATVGALLVYGNRALRGLEKRK